MTELDRANWKNRILAMAENLGEVADRIQLCGEARIDTRNTLYMLRDGVCVAVTRRDTKWSASPILLLGMRLIAWLVPAADGTALAFRYQPGACAIFWRERRAGEKRAPIAITSETLAFHDDLGDMAIDPDAQRAPMDSIRRSRPSLTRIARPSQGSISARLAT